MSFVTVTNIGAV